ncbi:MAG TPA: hypothetical protein VG518_06835 [Solirubrobacterales bacterium]|nr:hypothetical protein [Solirubrobacterales bacterium]
MIRGRYCATAAATLVALASASPLLLPPPAAAAPPGGPAIYASRPHAQGPKKEVAGPPAPGNGKGKAKDPFAVPPLGEAGGKGGAEAPTEPAVAGTEAQLKELGEEGQVDPIIGLGLRNPVCDHPDQIRDPQTRMACREFGTPESVYPASNYGFDIFIDTGIDAPEGIAMKGIVRILDGIWLAVTFVLKLVLDLLGVAFGLNPFGNGETMRRITGAIRLVFSTVTNPWLSTLVVMGGIAFAYKGLVRREVGATIGATLGSIAMIVVGLWVVHQPSQTVGRLASMSDQVALGVISAPHSGSVSRPSGAFAEEMSQTWERLVEVPFAGLNFSDVKWALGPPPPEAVEKAEEKFCDDVGARAQFEAQLRGREEDESAACGDFARRHYGKPKRVIDLYLRSSPNSPAREALWQYFDKDEADLYKSKVAAQGGDGVLTRLSMLALFLLALLGAVLLLAWLAIRLFTQAAIGFVLLLAAPFALFFPLLGDSGRKAFRTWGLTLLGAIAAKIVYAAFLSVVLLGVSILGRSGGSGGFLLATAFCWAVFLKRADLVGWLSIGDHEAGHPFSLHHQLMKIELGRRMLKTFTDPLKDVATRGRGGPPYREVSAEKEARAKAMRRLRSGALGVADAGPGGPRPRPAYASARGAKAGGERASSGTRPERAEPARSGAGGRAERDSRERTEAARGRRDAAESGAERPDYGVRAAEAREGEGSSLRLKGGEELQQGSRNPAPPAHAPDAPEPRKMTGTERGWEEAPDRERARREVERLRTGSQVPGRVVGSEGGPPPAPDVAGGDRGAGSGMGVHPEYMNGSQKKEDGQAAEVRPEHPRVDFTERRRRLSRLHRGQPNELRDRVNRDGISRGGS